MLIEFQIWLKHVSVYFPLYQSVAITSCTYQESTAVFVCTKLHCDPISPFIPEQWHFFLNLSEWMIKNKRTTYFKAMQNGWIWKTWEHLINNKLSYLIKKNTSAAQNQDTEVILNDCNDYGKLDRNFFIFMFSVLPKLFTAPIRMPILRKFGQVTHNFYMITIYYHLYDNKIFYPSEAWFYLSGMRGW